MLSIQNAQTSVLLRLHKDVLPLSVVILTEAQVSH